MKGQMEKERETREDLRSRFREINQIRQDREKVLLEQIDELQDEVCVGFLSLKIHHAPLSCYIAA